MYAIHKIEIHAGSLELTLIKRALSDLLDKVSAEGDFYCVSPEIESLIGQIESVQVEVGN
jgi:hypothetical protein